MALILDFARDPETGGLTWQYAGETKMDWNEQFTTTDPAGEPLFVAEDGGVWPKSKLVVHGEGNETAGS